MFPKSGVPRNVCRFHRFPHKSWIRMVLACSDHVLDCVLESGLSGASYDPSGPSGRTADWHVLSASITFCWMRPHPICTSCQPLACSGPKIFHLFLFRHLRLSYNVSTAFTLAIRYCSPGPSLVVGTAGCAFLGPSNLSHAYSCCSLPPVYQETHTLFGPFVAGFGGTVSVAWHANLR